MLCFWVLNKSKRLTVLETLLVKLKVVLSKKKSEYKLAEFLMTATEIKLIKSIKPQINRETHHKMFQTLLHTTRVFLISRVLARSSVIISLSYLSMSTNVYLMHFCQITGARWHIHKYMVLVCSKKAFYSKVLTDFVLRGWLGTCKFGKI